METGIYRLGDFTFDSREEYYAARLDRKKINYLQDEENLNYRDALNIQKKMKKENISFETDVGKSYVESLEQCIRHHKQRRIMFSVKLCCYVVILACISFFIVDGFFEYCSKRNMNFLQQRVAELKEEFAASAEKTQLDEEKKRQLIEQGETDQVVLENIMPQYRELFTENPYFTGWITIEGTGINYPVMKGPDNEYYLSHNMQNEYDKYGMLVMDKRCSFFKESPQYLVYGHNVQDGGMFGELKDYHTEKYYSIHPTITFDSLYESSEFDIVAVFTVSMDEELNDVSFYEYTCFSSEEIFDKYIKTVKEKSFYDTGIEPKFGDELLALVTCENSVKDGRFVVIAAKSPANKCQ